MKEEGVKRLYRGVTPVALGSIPSHAVQFGAYEGMKEYLDAGKETSTATSAVAGAFATMCHDAIVTPFDVVKQHMQLNPKKYAGLVGSFGCILKEHGWKAFYVSYSTTLIMNAPFMAAYFASYEKLKSVLGEYPSLEGHLTHFLAGGGAGALAGCISTPIDVIKTRLQLGNMFHLKASGPFDVARQIYKEQGLLGFTRGMTARIVYFIPSAAITWTTYEGVKLFLQSISGTSERNDS